MHMHMYVLIPHPAHHHGALTPVEEGEPSDTTDVEAVTNPTGA